MRGDELRFCSLQKLVCYAAPLTVRQYSHPAQVAFAIAGRFAAIVPITFPEQWKPATSTVISPSRRDKESRVSTVSS